MSSRISRKTTKVTITIPEYLLKVVDEMADDIESFRSEVITDLLVYCFDHEEVLNEVFPVEEEEEESENEGA
jgi:metal-responsive CopG/Arc/MetJ family transcriptional regulator